MTTYRTLPEETYEQRVDLKLWRQLFRFAWRYRPQVLGIMVAGAVTAAIDAALPLVTRQVIDDVGARGLAADLGRYAVCYALLTLALASSIFVFIWLAGRIQTAVSHDIRQDAFRNLQRLSFSFYDHRPVGWLMARMTSDCDRLSRIFAWGVLDLAWGTTLMGSIAGVMLVLHVELALVVLAIVPILAWISVVFRRRILASARVVRKTNSKITARYNEGIMGVRTTKVFTRESDNLAEFSDLSGQMRNASVRNQLQSAVYLPLVMTLGSLATGGALILGGVDVAVGGLTIGTLIAFLSYTARFFEPVQEIAHWFAELQMAQASAERVMSLIQAEPEIRDTPAVESAIATHSDRASPSLAPDGGPMRIERVEFRDVDFEYETGQRVLDGVSFEVTAGETIALVGATGGGKTTIVSLLCRFYEPTRGAILLDGVDYRQRSLRWLQSQLGIVLQTPHLFSGTIRQNIRYGRLEASDEEVEQAAKLVGADAVVAQLEGGWDTEVGEGGARLSTGQRQLVSFARAVLADPQILVMDEATSSIDTETEQRIQRGLDRMLCGRTCFVIAHRLSTIRNADRILVIEGGRIVEEGDHHELLAARGPYFELYAEQRAQPTAAAFLSSVGGPTRDSDVRSPER